MTSTFEGFTDTFVDVGDVTIHARTAGSGPPVLLLHGYPETSFMWRHVAPALADSFSIVATDLRGYGASSTPADDATHITYSKRAMAADQVAVMSALGHDRFAVVGHDRGGRVAHRLTLDHPQRVERAAVLDIVPTLYMFEHVDLNMAQTYFHWFFLAQPSDIPERLISSDPNAWIASRFVGRQKGQDAFDPVAIAEYASFFHDLGHVAASCADYRAAASIDLVHDGEDRAAGRRVRVPLLAMWGESSYVGRSFDVTRVWRQYADHVEGYAAPSDHYIPEEAPEFTTDVLRGFLLAGNQA